MRTVTLTDEANLRRPISRPLIHSTGMDVREGDTARAEESESRAVDLNSPGSSRGKSGEDYGAGNTEDRLLRAREIQRELGVSRATAYRMMTDGTLPAYRFGGTNGRRAMVRVSLRDLRSWLENHRGIQASGAQNATC